MRGRRELMTKSKSKWWCGRERLNQQIDSNRVHQCKINTVITLLWHSTWKKHLRVILAQPEECTLCSFFLCQFLSPFNCHVTNQEFCIFPVFAIYFLFLSFLPIIIYDFYDFFFERLYNVRETILWSVSIEGSILVSFTLSIKSFEISQKSSWISLINLCYSKWTGFETGSLISIYHKSLIVNIGC